MFFIVATAVSISAANYHNNGKTNTSIDKKNYCNFTDANNDGICDICNNNKSQCNGYFIDEDNDGICDNCKNNNPLCDGSHKQDRNHSSQQASQSGSGYKYGQSSSGSQDDSGYKYGQSSSGSQSGSGYKYGQSSSGSQSGSGYKYGQSSSSASGNQYGHHGNGLHTQQKLQIRDC